MPRSKIPLLLFVALVVGCSERSPTNGLATTTMKIGSETFTLEIANTSATREHGLMERDSMPADHGMIFVFKEPDELNFWMKNTRIPLDILYLDEHGKVVSIHQMKPYDRSGVPSDGLAKYAIELNVGRASEVGAKVGDVLEIPANAREPAE
jgi:uncharacterized membrane protein (UPF0127 family)